MGTKIIIAIDGFSSTGKSTIAKSIARKLGYVYVDTGAMYRAVTLFCMQNKLIDDTGQLDRKGIIARLPEIKIEFRKREDNSGADTYLNGVCVEDQIRSIAVASHVSAISAIAEVRQAMVHLQQLMGRDKGIVMDGRDIGTVVFPQAELKIFMTADPAVRAMRRFKELQAKGDKVSLDEIQKNIEDRDHADSNREVSPLRKADDAIVLDNSELTPDQQLAWIEERVNQCLANNSRLTVTIDDKSGFCYGVVRAIETAEKELEGEGTVLFSLGEIVHNGEEVSRLQKQGLSAIGRDDISGISGKKMLIRAHGEPPSTYEKAKANNIDVVDCTCPVVLKLQQRIKQAYETVKAINGQLVIFGERGHAEVIGLEGQIDNQAIIIEKLDEVDRLDFTRPIYLFSQTTKSLEGFFALQELIREGIEKHGGDQESFKVHNTTCRQVTGRQPHLQEFARLYDVVIFVSGKQSSNGKVLFQTCLEMNPNTYFVERPADLRPEWFVNHHTVGVCGATSTPKWIMEEVAAAIVHIQV